MTYVTTDLHGYSFDGFMDMLDSIGFSDDDYLYILGDVIDRGKDGIELLLWVMEQPNVELLLGNHERMLLDCAYLFEKITDDSINELTVKDIEARDLWLYNGGEPTARALAKQSRADINYVFEFLRDTPLFEAITVNDRDFILVHAGLGNFAPDKKLGEYTAEELTWTRPELSQRYFDDMTVIFGHTPTLFYGDKYSGRAIVTDTWINIDVGAAGGMTPMILRLDDMKEFYFDF